MSDTLPVIARLLAATNAHDLDALVGCFATEYVNETPAHPRRGFRGQDQVRRNWSSIFAGVPDLSASILAAVVGGSTNWTEWEMHGTRPDGSPHAMAGVVIFTVSDDRITSARFYLEPVEHTSGDVNAAVDRAMTAPRP